MVVALPEPNISLHHAIDELLNEAIHSNKFLGVSFLAVDRKGRSLYSSARGYRDFDKNEPMTVDTAGFMASMSKLMTSVAVMQTVEKKLVGLDDDVGLLVPELGDREILTSFDKESQVATFQKPKNRISLRQLLSHSSGFAYDFCNPMLGDWIAANGKDQEIFTGEWKAWVRPLVFNPGSSWQYGPGVDWAGKVVETVTKQTLEDYMRENIWAKVGMTNTTFHPERRSGFKILSMGARLSGEENPLSPVESPWPVPAPNDMGGCGLYSTAEDYAKFLGALISDEHPLLCKEALAELVKPQLSKSNIGSLVGARELGLVQSDIPIDISVDYALGGLVVTDNIPNRRKRGSLCWDGMTNPNWMFDLRTGIACTLLVQILPCPDLATKRLWTELEKVVYQHCAKR